MNNTVKNNVFGAPTGFNWQAANKNNGIAILSGAHDNIIGGDGASREGRKITGTACSNCTVEIFSDAQNEGRFFEGSVVADATGNFLWTGTFQGQFITATATDATFDTSMFSTATPAPFPWVMFMPSIIGH